MFSLICTSSHASGSDSGYYVEQAITAYGIISDAINNKQTIKNKENDFRLRMANTMGVLVVQKHAIVKARQIFNEFGSSDNYAIKTSSLAMSACLLTLESRLGEAIDQAEEMLNLSDRELLAKVGTYTKKTQDISASSDEAWDTYMKVSEAVAYALYSGMDKDPMQLSAGDMNKTFERMSITRKEVVELKKKIAAKFTSSVNLFNKKDYDKIGRGDIPAIKVYAVLNGGMKAADEK